MVARFMNRDVCPPSLKNTAIALVLIFLPTLVAAQPDLGTSILIAASGLFVLFLSGMSWKLIAVAAIALAAFIPVLWFFLMHGYQRDRVMMLLDPESDPLGAGYHIIQSKIAIGSGGLSGKGLADGTQSQLGFCRAPYRLYLRRVGRRAGADRGIGAAGTLPAGDHSRADDRRQGAKPPLAA